MFEQYFSIRTATRATEIGGRVHTTQVPLVTQILTPSHIEMDGEEKKLGKTKKIMLSPERINVFIRKIRNTNYKYAGQSFFW